VDSCTKYPVHIDANQVGSLGSTSTFRGNASGKDAIEVVSGTIATSQTWPNQGVPYLITGNVWISDASNNPVLTLAPGDTLKIAPGFEILVGATMLRRAPSRQSGPRARRSSSRPVSPVRSPATTGVTSGFTKARPHPPSSIIV